MFCMEWWMSVLGTFATTHAMLLEVLLVLAAIALYLYRQTILPPGLPPGSLGWPVIGVLPSRQRYLTDHFRDLKKKYGRIFTTKWGSHILVIISDAELIKKAFQHPLLQGRAPFHSIDVLNSHNYNTGVLYSYEHVWTENRRFLLRHLRDLGMGRTVLETSIQDEAAMLVRYFEQQDLLQPVAMDWGINVAVVNVIWQMLAGIRYEADEPRIIEMVAKFDEDIAVLQGPIFLMDIFPWLLPLTPRYIYNKMFGGNILRANRQQFRDMALEIVLEHRKTLNPENPRDIIDYYLLEVDKQNDNPNTTFKSDYSDLLTVMSDMFLAGSETSSNTLRWMILYMATQPKIQKRIQEDLDKVVPKDILPSLADRTRLPYVDAVILDVLRLSSLAPIGANHTATSDVNFEGYFIPKGTIMFGVTEHVHHDPALWEKPNKLHPEHFLDDEGRLNSKRDGFMPFLVGRRQCLGESLARMELFLFTAAILQRFEISPPEGVTLDLETDPNKYLLNQPRPFKVMLKKRF